MFRKIGSTVSKLFALFRRSNSEIAEWYKVDFDQEQICRVASPPGREPFQDSVQWEDITMVVFEASGVPDEDSIYLFSSQRPESYVIPCAAHGAGHLWNEIIERGLFDPELAVEAALSQGGLYSWPPAEA